MRQTKKYERINPMRLVLDYVWIQAAFAILYIVLEECFNLRLFDYHLPF